MPKVVEPCSGYGVYIDPAANPGRELNKVFRLSVSTHSDTKSKGVSACLENLSISGKRRDDCVTRIPGNDHGMDRGQTPTEQAENLVPGVVYPKAATLDGVT